MRRLAMCIALLVGLGSGACGSDDLLTPAGEGGGGSGAKPAPVCTPGATIPCASAGLEKDGVGICKAGFRVCDDAGLSHGVCQDEVVPAVETCATPVDDDCDGEVNESGEGCACDAGESIPCYGGPADTQDVGPCAPGTQVCLSGEAGFGECNGDVLPQVETCGTTVDESCDGTPYDGCPGDLVVATAIPDSIHFFRLIPHPDGGVLGVGLFTETIDLGAGPLVHAGGHDALVARFASDGSHLWSRAFGAPGDQYVSWAALTPSGGMILSGGQNGPADYGGGLVTGSGSAQGIVLELDPAGEFVSQTVIEATEYATGGVASLLPNGDRVVSAAFKGEMVLGGQVFSGAENGAVTGRMTPAGDWAWVKQFSSAESIVAGARPYPSGGAVLIVAFEGMVILDGVTFTGAGGSDSLLARLDDDGDVLWAKAIAGPDLTAVGGLVPSANGELSMFVTFRDSVDLGGDVLTQQFESAEVAVARLDAGGNHLWSKRVGSTTLDDSWLSYNYDPVADGDVTAAFFMQNGTLDVGGGEIGSLDTDLVLVRLGADGLPQWFRHAAPAPGLFGSGALTVDPDGNTWFVIGSEGPLDLGGGPLAAGQHLLKLAP